MHQITDITETQVLEMLS